MTTGPAQATRTADEIDVVPADHGARFRMGMRRLASGVSLVTTAQGDQRFGLIATSVSSLAVDPPSLVACIDRSSSAHRPIQEAKVFCVNFLGTRHREIARQFSSSARRGERFSVGKWAASSAIAMPFLRDALASFDCRVEQVVAYATHSIFIARVIEVRLGEEPPKPMVYFDQGFATLAS